MVVELMYNNVRRRSRTVFASCILIFSSACFFLFMHSDLTKENDYTNIEIFKNFGERMAQELHAREEQFREGRININVKAIPNNQKEEETIPKIFFKIDSSVMQESIIYRHPRMKGVSSMVKASPVPMEKIFDSLCIIAVFSNPSAFSRRNIIRQTYGKTIFSPRRSFIFVFFLGLPKDNSPSAIQNRIDAEAHEYNDIVQFNLIDNFKNSVKKSIWTLRWIATNFNSAVAMVRIDDSIFLNTHILSDVFNDFDTYFKQGYKFKLFLGNIITNHKLNTSLLKYSMVTEEDWKGFSVYPPYIEGRFFIMTMSIVKEMSEIDLVTRRMFPSEVYFSILAAKINITIEENEYCRVWHFINFDVFKKAMEGFSERKIVAFDFDPLKEEAIKVWDHIQKRENPH